MRLPGWPQPPPSEKFLQPGLCFISPRAGRERPDPAGKGAAATPPLPRGVRGVLPGEGAGGEQEEGGGEQGVGADLGFLLLGVVVGFFFLLESS